MFLGPCMNKLRIFKLLITGICRIDDMLLFLEGVHFRQEYGWIDFAKRVHFRCAYLDVSWGLLQL